MAANIDDQDVIDALTNSVNVLNPCKVNRFCCVYRLNVNVGGRRAVVKIVHRSFDDDAEGALQNEAQALFNVNQLLTWGRTNHHELYYFVMEDMGVLWPETGVERLRNSDLIRERLQGEAHQAYYDHLPVTHE
jgi:hypothetical protein